ncbi:HutP protein [Halobacteroides halobius DSM 5150]|uniref:Hut operon positive regulatory protein n=1 Tax=Halobacteroides halobius (strain ATCC 35273 / DSM 5150 / MD-1) TaxID=748449 RepID=L0KA10_HALHC|nr:HutP family protein [Halobacteroides halobius]AGB41355.1 HutP protein [Halobacteroides halobius DSM 5150]
MVKKDALSKEVAAAAIKMSLSDRKEESKLKEKYRVQELEVAAVDFGGEFNDSIKKIIERAVVAAEREGVIDENDHAELGAVAGAAREAVTQIQNKATGFNVGGKIGVARQEDHISVAVFFAIGLLHLNEMSIGLGHRAVHK